MSGGVSHWLEPPDSEATDLFLSRSRLLFGFLEWFLDAEDVPDIFKTPALTISMTEHNIDTFM